MVVESWAVVSNLIKPVVPITLFLLCHATLSQFTSALGQMFEGHLSYSISQLAYYVMIHAVQGLSYEIFLVVVNHFFEGKNWIRGVEYSLLLLILEWEFIFWLYKIYLFCLFFLDHSLLANSELVNHVFPYNGFLLSLLSQINFFNESEFFLYPWNCLGILFVNMLFGGYVLFNNWI